MSHSLDRTLLPLACAGLAATTLAAQATRYRDAVFAGVDVHANIAYGSAVNRFTNRRETLLLDRYEPRGDTAGERPAVVVVHGGGFHAGDKATSQFRRIGADLARRGFVAVSINYRLKPRRAQLTRQVVTDAAHDCKAAIRFLRRNAKPWRIDVTRIASIGSSAGSITVLEAAYVPGEGNSGNSGFSSKQQAVVDLWGFLSDENEMGKGEPPVSIIHGTKDRTVPFTRAQALRARALAVGVPFEYHPLQGAGHAPWNLYPTFLPDVLAFYWEQLGLGKLAGLRARPGFRSPGQLDLDHFGIARDLFALLVSNRRVAIDLGTLGVLCTDPAALVIPQVGAFPAGPRLPAQGFSVPVPAGLAGRTFHWQALRVDPTGRARLLTDCVATAF